MSRTAATAVHQTLLIPAGNVTLEADVVVPAPARGVVLFAHGSGSSRHSPRNRYVAAALQSAVGLAAHSAVVYLAQPVLANAVWGFAFLISAAVRRPLAGALACAWYPFPGWFRQTEQFKRVYGVESVVWGVYMLLRSALRLAVLLQGSLESFLLVVLLTGTPIMLLLVAWSIRYAIRGLTTATPAL